MSRGGIKQVVAATTLAAMAMTGNTVSAFCLANALAEGSAHVETTPEQENNGGAFEGVTVESIEEGNGDEDGGTDAVAATDAGSADEVVVMDAEEAIMEVEDALFGEEEAPLNEAGEAVEPETIEEVEFDLSEANGEAEGMIIDENPEDPEQTMKDLINMAVEERRTEGIYAALNTTFATLAENAEALVNPETGVIETDGNAIVNMTYDALKSSFDNTPEELMGAIGAAAMRADSAGYIQILGGDQALVNLASINIDADQVEKDILKSGKIGYDSFLDGAALANPAFKPYVPLFKAIGGELLSASSFGSRRPAQRPLRSPFANRTKYKKSSGKHLVVFQRTTLYCPMIFGVRAARPAEPAKPAACLIIWNNGNPENIIKTVSSGCHTPRKARIFRRFQGLYLIPTRSHQPVSKRFCLGGLARGIHIIRITLKVLAIKIFVVILLSR